MAEIRVEKRKPIWPWILAGLAALAIVIFLVAGNDNDRNRDRNQSAAYDSERNYDNDAMDNTRGTADRDNTYNSGDRDNIGNRDRNAVADNPQNDRSGMSNNNGDRKEVAEFVNYVRTDLRDETLDHKNLTRAFNELRDATQSIAEMTGYPKDSIADPKDFVDMIDKESFEEQNAEKIRRTADVFADHLQKMQRAKFPQLRADALQLVESSKKISTSQPAIDQSAEIRSFLAEAADLVEKME